VKSEEAVLKRLKNLRKRYLNKYIKVSQTRLHKNCVYNVSYTLNQTSLKANEIQVNESLWNNKFDSIVIIQDNQSTHFCAFGSEKPDEWNGIICDNDDVAKSCKWFKPKVPIDKVEIEFEELMKDDEFVLNHYPDIAALQWVLDDRIHFYCLSWWDRIRFWFLKKLNKVKHPVIPLLQEVNDKELEEIWKDDNTSHIGP
jgi:hypothetical protein